MRSPLISVTFGFFSVTGGCSNIGDFPSWAMTARLTNIKSASEIEKRTTIDFIDLSFTFRRGLVTATASEGNLRERPPRPSGLRHEHCFATSEPLVSREPFNRAAGRPILIGRIARL